MDCDIKTTSTNDNPKAGEIDGVRICKDAASGIECKQDCSGTRCFQAKCSLIKDDE